MSVEVQELSRSYGAQKAVDNISFRVNPGEIVGFLGPNGAGKSTTMKMITGFLKPDSGTTTVAGITVQEDPLAARRRLGYLAEANPLYYDMYVREYLTFVAEAHQLKERKQAVSNAISRVGLTPEQHKKTGQLSKGYKQRVGLAAALIHDPEVLILDEPTTGLDPNQIMEIRDVIRQLGRNKTVVFSSHILQEVEAVCDRVIIIHQGRIVADETIESLRQSRGAGLVTVQFTAAIPREHIAGIPSVARVEEIAPGHFRLHTSDPDQVRKELLQRSLLHNLNIISLQSGEQRLEDVFRELTSTTATQQYQT